MSRPGLRRAARAAALALSGLVLAIVAAAVLLDRLFPPETAALADTSRVVVDRTGAPLRVFTTAAGRWRLPADPDRVSPAYRDLLIATEDGRFFAHPGVDPLAAMRAAWQLATQGRVVSGGSTLTMQLVRMLHPRPRTLSAKLIEAARALQIEVNWSKRRILSAYLTLVPMGGNLEGVRAGSLAWFGKEPADLSEAEAALLVALPQDPNGRRPDRHAGRAEAARARVLRRAAAAGLLSEAAVASARASPVPRTARPLPMLAPHLAEELARTAAPGAAIATTLDRAVQDGAERLLAQSLAALPRPVNLAAVVADWRTGAVLARVGSAGYLDAARSGAIDMTRPLRSPGSTLKPFIYGVAFDGLLAHPGSLLHDAPTRFDDYAPHNFDGGFSGDVSLREALQRSLNLPAVVTLQRVGPVVFTERLKAVGLPLVLPEGDAAPGLPIALGGAGASLDTLVALYAALADGGRVKPLTEQPDAIPTGVGGRLFGEGAADAVLDILAGMPPPRGAPRRMAGIAYKTGTSFRFRDGWAVGLDDARVIGVWMGRADGGSCACVGAAAAAVLFRLFDTLPPAPLRPRLPAPFFAAPPPPALLRLDGGASSAEGPAITFPVDQSRLLVDLPGPGGVKLAASGGERPYRWFVDGRPLDSRPYAREAFWQPEEEGFSTLSVVDARGRVARAAVRVIARGGS